MVLIPKSKDANTVDNFRNIVMSNFIFKIITKILATRFGRIAGRILSPTQFGFIPGRHIHDCIALVSEGFNILHNWSDNNMILKIDIRKAFDTISWDFLLYVLHRFGFSEKFVACFRGVRQGDPLSPLLFCIAEEVLGRFIALAMDQSRLSAFTAPRGIVFPSSILYADDIVIMCGATSSNARVLL
ncbi:hypothetical protein DH2020_015628 [Rehmannia glutinosa]|uniref:Reverse transcriptase domain-containing protein n=1 Tax=Rehmannia glutinosa TaxID=99300 RepID=A0ABR0WTR9_REHGL